MREMAWNDDAIALINAIGLLSNPKKQFAFQHMGDLLAGMRMLCERRVWRDFKVGQHHMLAGDAPVFGLRFRVGL